MGIAIAIVAVVALAVVGLLVTARSRATTGRLSRETRKRDEAGGGVGRGRGRRAGRRGERGRGDGRGPGPGRRGAQGDRVGRLRGARAPRRGHPGGLRAGRPRRARRHPPPVLQPLDPGRLRSRARRVRRRRAGVPLAVGGRRLRRQDRRSGPRPTPRTRSTTRSRSTTRRRRPTSSPSRRTTSPRRRRCPAYTPPIIAGMEAGLRRAVPEVRAPRLPRPVVRQLAVVRVPVPRLEVQPGRREAGWPGAARPRPLRAQRRRAATSSSTPASSCSVRRSAPTPPDRAPRERPVCETQRSRARMSGRERVDLVEHRA